MRPTSIPYKNVIDAGEIVFPLSQDQVQTSARWVYDESNRSGSRFLLNGAPGEIVLEAAVVYYFLLFDSKVSKLNHEATINQFAVGLANSVFYSLRLVTLLHIGAKGLIAIIVCPFVKFLQKLVRRPEEWIINEHLGLVQINVNT